MSLPRSLLAALTACAAAACAPNMPGLDPDAPVEPGPDEVGVLDAGLGAALGAAYDGTEANIIFNVFSSRATRIELWLYKQPTNFNQSVRYVMVKDAATNVWTKTVSVATLQNTYGFTGPVYYGYRAWGPNWPYVSSWT